MFKYRLEKQFRDALCRALNQHPYCHFKTVHGDTFNAGEPDISGSYFGLRVAIECKMEGNICTPRQMANQQQWADSLTCVFLAVYDRKNASANFFIVQPKDRDYRLDFVDIQLFDFKPESLARLFGVMDNRMRRNLWRTH